MAKRRSKPKTTKAKKRGGSNGYASMVWNRTQGKKAARKKGAKAPRAKQKRRRLDNYETPTRDTNQLTRLIAFKGPIKEPACGSGRMVRALQAAFPGMKIVGSDLKMGQAHDFIAATKTWPGDIVTNPPYGEGNSDAFTYKALELADGRVAMLVELKFLTGDKRAAKLFRVNKPEMVIIIPYRIYFYAGAKPIPAQFYNHCWIIWPPRKKRGSGVKTQLVWADDTFDFG